MKSSPRKRRPILRVGMLVAGLAIFAYLIQLVASNEDSSEERKGSGETTSSRTESAPAPELPSSSRGSGQQIVPLVEDVATAVSASTEAQQPVRLPPLSLIVVNSEGGGVPDAVVWRYSAGPGQGDMPSEVGRSNEAGYCDVAYNSPRERLLVEHDIEGTSGLIGVADLNRRADGVYSIEIRRSASIWGRVSLPDGRPLSGARVLITASEGQDDIHYLRKSWPRSPVKAICDANGAYSLVLDAPFSGSITAIDVSGGSSLSRRVGASAGSVIPVDLVIGGVWKLSVTVVLQSDGSPVSGADVHILGDGLDEHVSRTNVEGLTEIDLPAEGAYLVRCKKAGFVQAGREVVRVNGQSLSPVRTIIQIKPEASVAGQVTYQDGRPARKVWIRLMPVQDVDGPDDEASRIFALFEQGWVPSTFSADDGTFEVTGLDNLMAYRLCVRRGDRESVIPVQAGDRDVLVVVGEGVHVLPVSFQVVDAADGNPVMEFEYKVGADVWRSCNEVNGIAYFWSAAGEPSSAVSVRAAGYLQLSSDCPNSPGADPYVIQLRRD